MIPESVTQSYRAILSEIQSDLSDTVGQVLGGVKSSELAPALTTVIDPYLELGSMTGATFYEEQRAYQDVPGRYAAQTITESEEARIGGIVGAARAEETYGALSKLIVGAAARLLTERVNDTVLGNAEADTAVSWKYQRVPRPNCCAFCGMLASRGAVYTSAESAGQVVGAGVPIPRVKKRGGQAKGIKTRGSRRMGESFHDNCYCTIVTVKNGNAVEMSNDERDTAQAKWWNVYESAKVSAGEDYKPVHESRTAPDGSILLQWYWQDSKGNKFRSDGVTDRIVNAMRREKYALDKTGDF